MSDRETVLQRIAARVTRRPAGSPDSRHGGVRPHSRELGSDPRHVNSSTAALVDAFVTEVEMLTGIVHHASNAEEACRAVLDVCKRHQSSRVLAWDERWCGVPGLDAALAGAGIEADRGWLPSDPAARLARLAVLDTILVGVTGAVGAIAESGSVALVSGPGRPRTASLLPPVHVAIVPVSRLYATLPDFLAAHPDAAEQGSNLVLVTGPSRTADIEMTLTRGVHGPGEVHVVLRTT
jgi:L-lactate dehydrogenase complex protein LldG